MISFPINSVFIINSIMVVLLLITLISGYYNGFIKQIVQLIVLIVSILIAWPTSGLLSNSIPILSRDLGYFNDVLFGQFIYEISNSILWFVILFIALFVGLYVIAKPFYKKIRQYAWIKPLDKILGVVIALIPLIIWFLLFMIITLSPIFLNGKSTLEASMLNTLVPVAQSLSDTFVGQVDPYGIVVKLTNQEELTEEDIANIPIWLEEFGVKEESVVIVEKFINEEVFTETDINTVQEYITKNEITEGQARAFLEKFGLAQSEIDAAISEFNFK